jgi:single-stranded-DNA-specific exonuclease
MIAQPRIQLRKVGSAPHSLPDSMHPVVRRVLLARGVDSPELLDLGLGRLHSPDALGGLDRAAELVANAVCEERDLLVVGDFDADGATGTAVAIRALRSFGASRVRFRVSNRFDFGYGLTPGLVDTLAEEPPDLLITVDSGICCNAGVARARELGCAVIVTDHHLPGEQLPGADAIVNPNCPGDGFPSKALAGVGVVFYLMSAVRGVLRERGWFGGKRREPNLARLLDLVALGTIADLVPLDHNNRILARQGLERIRRGMTVPGLLALLRLGKRDYRHLVANDLAFAVAPRLNAAGRLEDMGVGIRCLLADDPEEAGALAAQLDELNHSRRSMQEQMQGEAMAMVRGIVDRLEQQPLPNCLCLHDPSWHQGIVGLVASRVKDALHRPAVVFAPESDGATDLKGSARSVRGLHIRDVLALVDARNPGMITAFGGHAMAAGLTLPADRLEAFSQALEDGVDAYLDGGGLDAHLLTDGELTAGDIGLALAEQLRELGPWGQRFPEPLFEGSFEVIDQRVVGGAHLKMVLRPLDGHDPVDAIAFGKLPEDLPDTAGVRLLYRLDVNRFRGAVSCQLLVEHIVRATG